MTSSDGLSDFRAEVRAWAENHIPVGWESRFGVAVDDEFRTFQRDWLRTLRTGGYAAPHWAKEWGGGGYSLAEQIVIFEEFSRLNAPPLRNYFVALNHAYATLMHAGNDEQRQRHLPAILDGEVWCQGFSEPGAGSDLAGLRTRAVRTGDVYVVNGQKVWSSRAAFADRCLLLARTDPKAPKRRGISYFLLDMKSPGVEARPIRQATGAAEFCEVFLTDVEVPVTDLVGEENDGWKIAQSTLSAERGLAQLELSERMAAAMSMVEALIRERRSDGRSAIDDDSVREQFVTLQTEVVLFRRLCKKMVEDLVRRGGTGPESSIVKVFYSELLQRMMAFGVSLAGLDTHRLTFKPVSAGYESGRWMLDYIDSFGWVIAGGTNEIQRSLIGERVLGLPREPVPT
ncbi:Acyl-CoA dehydrogenase related to the alkylation response protein AidB [Mycobacterium rhizamassiliense]|jgi:alkylation response protein AidB-like acyl-CoA dehydrogenase|uniref:Acyl-CoA dehydrogenase related to the alkylation response protein AidB n=1 Tax=Mycobacterium rhizamassiliense TaxID=1841860 RepID=A0A2U3NQF6_9MYCO|nr:acyl-CoA dehydrogenase family protein [Mycobacterium rhizamassiliense]SPM33740.1 Acyl-CoA dehydrogenase related to the alkylation response protein AidB [Mycobacterium rhizamassiliense]